MYDGCFLFTVLYNSLMIFFKSNIFLTNKNRQTIYLLNFFWEKPNNQPHVLKRSSSVINNFVIPHKFLIDSTSKVETIRHWLALVGQK